MKKITLSKSVPFIVLMGIAIIALFIPSLKNFDDGKYNAADTAWIIVATALVFLNDTRPCLFLWRNGAQEKRAFHHDQKFCCHRDREYLMGYSWIQPLFRAINRWLHW